MKTINFVFSWLNTESKLKSKKIDRGEFQGTVIIIQKRKLKKKNLTATSKNNCRAVNS